jgi:hypothetical protein
LPQLIEFKASPSFGNVEAFFIIKGLKPSIVQTPKQLISHSQSGPRILPFWNSKLRAQGHDLKAKMMSEREKNAPESEKSGYKAGHGPGFIS